MKTRWKVIHKSTGEVIGTYIDKCSAEAHARFRGGKAELVKSTEIETSRNKKGEFVVKTTEE